jgi:hypothetical protein
LSQISLAPWSAWLCLKKSPARKRITKLQTMVEPVCLGSVQTVQTMLKVRSIAVQVYLLRIDLKCTSSSFLQTET